MRKKKKLSIPRAVPWKRFGKQDWFQNMLLMQSHKKSWTSYAGLLTDGKHFHIGGQRLMHYVKPGHALDCVALQLTCLTKGTAVMESKIYFRTYHLCAVLKYFTEVSITFHAHLLLSLLQKIGEYSCTLHYMYLAVKINFLYTNHLTLTLNLNILAS